MSAVVILLFVIVPIYSQGHFVRKFHNEGSVYADVRSFGKEAWGGAGPRNCLDDRFCPHPDAGRYSRMQPAPGYEGGYFDYAYKYGEKREGLSIAALTFFPVLQPAAIVALNAFSVLLLIGWLRALFGTAERSTEAGTEAVARTSGPSGLRDE